jgi:FdhE protein
VLAQSIRKLEALAADDPSLGPLARLQALALAASTGPAWEGCGRELRPGRAVGVEPLLHGQTLLVNPVEALHLLARLGEATARLGIAGSEGLCRAAAARPSDATLDPLALLQACLVWDAPALEQEADRTAVDPRLLRTVGDLAVLSLLLACAPQAAGLMHNASWQAGYCPFCAAWPVLAEVWGEERRLWLRCGRCGTGWRFRQQLCQVCGNEDHKSLGYLAPADEPLAERVLTCDRCHGYLKSFNSLSPVSPSEVVVRDLAGVSLDLAAIERGYGRPERPGFPLRLEVRASPAK